MIIVSTPFFFLFHSINESFVTAIYHISYSGENNQNSTSKMDTNDKNVKNGNGNILKNVDVIVLI